MDVAGIGALAKALATAQRGIRSAQKDRRNPHYGQTYATLASVWEACRTQLADNGLAVVQTTEVNEAGTLILVTRLMHESGAEVSSRYPVLPVKTDPQGYGSALTYARRYSLASIVGVAPDDDDAESAHGRATDPAPAAAPPSREPGSDDEPDWVGGGSSEPAPSAPPAGGGDRAPCPSCGKSCGKSKYPKPGAEFWCTPCKKGFSR